MTIEAVSIVISVIAMCISGGTYYALRRQHRGD